MRVQRTPTGLIVLACLATRAQAENHYPLTVVQGQEQTLPVGSGLQVNPSTTMSPSVNIPCIASVAPASPQDGDEWCTSAGLFIRVGGSTVGPLGSGSAVAPGGASGQLQYNSGGAFGGFTVGGDGALNTATGALSITATGGVAFGYFATGTDASNLTGALSLSRFGAQSTNVFLAGPSTGAVAPPIWRSLVGADLPTPSASTLGGVESIASVSHSFLTSISTSGVPSLAQPAFADLGGNIDVSQMNSGAGASTSTYWRGDGTWVTPSSSLPVVGSGDLLGNSGSTSTTAMDTTLSALLDRAIGSTQGSVLYRGASSWVSLGPGTSGEFLETGGPGGNLSWGNPVGATSFCPIPAASGFTTWVNQSGASITDNTPLGGPLVLSILGTGTLSSAVSARLQSVPAGSWTLVTNVTLSGRPAQSSSGEPIPVILYDSVSTKLWIIKYSQTLSGSTPTLTITQYNNPTSFNSSPTNVNNIYLQPQMWYKVQYVSTGTPSITWSVSMDGFSWITVLSTTSLWITPTHIGFGADNQSNPSGQIMAASLNCWKLTSP